MNKIASVCLACFIAAALLILPSYAMTLAGSKTAEGHESRVAGGTSAIDVKIRKISAIVEKKENHIIYTDQGTFDLTGANVVDMSNKRKERGPKEKLVVEMTFVNGKLVEAVIH